METRNTEWFYKTFQSKLIGDTWHCYGTVDGIDYSFQSNTQENAVTLAMAHLQKTKVMGNEELIRALENNYAIAVENDRLTQEYKKLQEELSVRDKKWERLVADLHEKYSAKFMAVYHLLQVTSQGFNHKERNVIVKAQTLAIKRMIDQPEMWALTPEDAVFFKSMYHEYQ